MTRMPADSPKKGMHIYPEPVSDEPAVSSDDMTGLIPAGSPDDAERESYRSLFPYLPKPGGA